jgi:hypothetical protein
MTSAELLDQAMSRRNVGYRALASLGLKSENQLRAYGKGAIEPPYNVLVAILDYLKFAVVDNTLIDLQVDRIMVGKNVQLVKAQISQTQQQLEQALSKLDAIDHEPTAMTHYQMFGDHTLYRA